MNRCPYCENAANGKCYVHRRRKVGPALKNKHRKKRRNFNTQVQMTVKWVQRVLKQRLNDAYIGDIDSV